MTPQEQIDLDSMKVKIQELKISCYDSLLSLMQIPPEQLAYTGHRSIPEGLLYRVQSHQSRIDKLIKEHLKKYPDR